MTRLAPLFAALLLAAPAAAQDQATPPAAEPASEPPSVPDARVQAQQFDLAREKVANCEGEKFVFAWGIGAHPTKVTLCSDKGASREEVIRMLDEAATKIEQSKGIAEDRRTALAQQIRGKIVELQGGIAAKPAPVETESAAAKPVPPPVAVPSPPPPSMIADYPTAATPVVRVTPYKPVPIVARPRLAFECMTPGEIGSGGPCVTLTRDTIITIKSGAALAKGFSLRFNRQGEDRGEVALGAMRKGQSIRLNMPQTVCRGVLTSEVELRVTSGGRTVGTEGPFLLRC